jgi:hypothetical protein
MVYGCCRTSRCGSRRSMPGCCSSGLGAAHAAPVVVLPPLWPVGWVEKSIAFGSSLVGRLTALAIWRDGRAFEVTKQRRRHDPHACPRRHRSAFLLSPACGPGSCWAAVFVAVSGSLRAATASRSDRHPQADPFTVGEERDERYSLCPAGRRPSAAPGSRHEPTRALMGRRPLLVRGQRCATVVFAVYVAGSTEAPPRAATWVTWNKGAATRQRPRPHRSATWASARTCSSPRSPQRPVDRCSCVPAAPRRFPPSIAGSGRVYVPTAFVGASPGSTFRCPDGRSWATRPSTPRSSLKRVTMLILAVRRDGLAHRRRPRLPRARALGARLFLVVKRRLVLPRRASCSGSPSTADRPGFDPETFRGPFLTVLAFAPVPAAAAVLEAYLPRGEAAAPRTAVRRAVALCCSRAAMGLGILVAAKVMCCRGCDDVTPHRLPRPPPAPSACSLGRRPCARLPQGNSPLHRRTGLAPSRPCTRLARLVRRKRRPSSAAFR